LPNLTISIILDDYDFYRYISLFFNNGIFTDKAMFIDIYPCIKFPDVGEVTDLDNLSYITLHVFLPIHHNIFSGLTNEKLKIFTHH
jgi:hypothetical protein